MSEPAHGVASAEAAWLSGVEAARSSDFSTALRWLERAQRLARGDPRIALDLANIRLQAGGAARIAEAAAAFEALTERYDVAVCWVGLVVARRLQGEHEKAAKALQALLSRHCVPKDQGFAEVASAVAQAAGWPGWCGVDASGRLHIAVQDGAVTGFVAAAPVALSHLDAAPEGSMELRSKDAALLGSPLDPAAFRRCEGVVETAGAALFGWASRPGRRMVCRNFFSRMPREGGEKSRSGGSCLPATMRR